MISIIKTNKVSVSVVSGMLVIATAYGTCTVDPNEEAIQEAVQEKIAPKEESEAPVEENKSEEGKEAAESEAAEEPKVDVLPGEIVE